jgi:hypothetical protein
MLDRTYTGRRPGPRRRRRVRGDRHHGQSTLLHGVRINGQIATTYSVVMRAHSRTVRYVKAFHDLTRKTIRLHSRGRDTTL